MTERLNTLSDDELQAELRAVGGAAWARALARQRPFPDAPALLRAADATFDTLTDEQWRDAFAAAAVAAPERTDDATADAARIALHLYQERFGHPFVAVTAGDTADELLMRVRIRLGNEPDVEWRVSCDEQRRAARLRLQRLAARPLQSGTS